MEHFDGFLCQPRWIRQGSSWELCSLMECASLLFDILPHGVSGSGAEGYHIVIIAAIIVAIDTIVAI